MNKLLILITILLILHSSYETINQTQHLYKYQRVNHMDPQDLRVFGARYWIFDQFYKKDGPVFLYICPEAECTGIPQNRQFPAVLAERFNGIVLSLEHRYYGLSQPFGDDSLKSENLKYLTVENALADLSSFIKYVRENQIAGVTIDNPWITIGGSYPGALSAWFRQKYQHLTIGALASSAVVDSISDFYQFDEILYDATLKSGQKCLDQYRAAYNLIDTKTKDAATFTQMKTDFNANQGMTAQEFNWFVVDTLAMVIQYGRRVELCDSLINAANPDALYDIVKTECKTNDPLSYSVIGMKDTTIVHDHGYRQWTYQYASQLGYFQGYHTGSAPNKNMRPESINQDFFNKFLKDSYNLDFHQDSDFVNLRYGGKDIKTDHLIMTNGMDDPWQPCSILPNEVPKDEQENIFAYISNCADCGHCVELYTPKDDDPQEVKDIRDKIIGHFTDWINEYWANKSLKHDLECE